MDCFNLSFRSCLFLLKYHIITFSEIFLDGHGQEEPEAAAPVATANLGLVLDYHVTQNENGTYFMESWLFRSLFGNYKHIANFLNG